MTTDQVREREDKYDVESDWVLPDLVEAELAASTAVRELGLKSTYFDTAQHDLLRHHVTLRHRSGDSDVGWQLKLPDGVARTEVRIDGAAASEDVPAELQELVAGLRTGRRLVPVATIATRRMSTALLDADGAQLAEVDDDHVTATVTRTRGAVTVLQWREVEVELGTGGEDYLAKVGKKLRRAGAQRATTVSKLARALGAATPAQARAGKPPTVGHLVRRYVDEQYQALVAGDLALRRGLDIVHPTRVATRRLRSALRVLADIFEPDAAAHLDTELAWYADLLGGVRDLEVLREHIEAEVAALPPELVLGPVVAHLDQVLAADHLAARKRLDQALRSRRYLALLREVRSWDVTPPFTDAAWAPAAAITGYVDRAQRKIGKRMDAARSAPDEHHVEALHRVRKTAKRARYVAELAEPVLGKQARRLVKRDTKLQDLLGTHQDAAVAMALLRRVGAEAGTRAGHNGFTYGLLYQAERERSERAERSIRKRVARLV